MQNPPYYYDLEIVVSKGIRLEIAADLSVGTLRTTLSEVTIEGLDLDTSTGGIDMKPGYDNDLPNQRMQRTAGR